MHRRGFALLEIIIVLGLIAIMVSGIFYLSNNNLEGGKNIIKTGVEAEKKILEIERQIKNQNQSSSSEENIINELSQ